jgi:hypothetical protein
MARKDDGIVWDFDTISSVFFLLLFLVIVGQSSVQTDMARVCSRRKVADALYARS